MSDQFFGFMIMVLLMVSCGTLDNIDHKLGKIETLLEQPRVVAAP